MIFKMKEIIKFSGLFVILLGIIILVISFLRGVTSNTGLIVSILMILFGFIGYLLINRYIED